MNGDEISGTIDEREENSRATIPRRRGFHAGGARNLRIEASREQVIGSDLVEARGLVEIESLAIEVARRFG